MAQIKRRRKAKKKDKQSDTSKLIKEAEEEALEGMDDFLYRPISTDLLISTGSTLIDLAICGGRVRGGGIPGNILIEIFGQSSMGKTALGMEICGSTQFHGGTIKVLDPESRLDQEYAKTYDAEIPKENYSRPDTVNDIINEMWDWEPKDTSVINTCLVDSIASLSTEVEMKEEDKRGQQRAKDLSAGLRKLARKIGKDNKLTVFTNQIRDGGTYGPVTPGGFAVRFYSTLRLDLRKPSAKGVSYKVEKKKKLKSGKEVSKVIGIRTDVNIVKNHIDDEWRMAPLYIIYGVGVDDVRANLQWYKDMTSGTKYDCIDKEYASMDSAIRYIEENNLELDLREKVIDLWEEIEHSFRTTRKKKVRF